MICRDNKRLHSCFLFKVNSSISCSSLSWDISSYCAGVSPQKPPVSVTWQWIWEDSLTHLEAKDTTLANVCVCTCMHSSLPYTVCASISTPINQLHVHYLEMFPECVSNHIKHTSGAQQTNVTGIQLQGKNLKQLLSIALSFLCTVCLGNPRDQ